ncbi:unnamed protein product [Pipistrellus nathusii]|uniref:Uncharacterized protein n=1 Tax=Pipistrellus nathusii TaxID=59473 RepID=A0ABN9ZIB1_PIPNA
MPQWRAAPLTSLDRNVLRGQQGRKLGRDGPGPLQLPDNGWDQAAGTETSLKAFLGTQARQAPARRQLRALTPWLAPAGPAAAAGTSLGTAWPLKGCFGAAVRASIPSLASCHPQPPWGGGRPWAGEVLPRV